MPLTLSVGQRSGARLFANGVAEPPTSSPRCSISSVMPAAGSAATRRCTIAPCLRARSNWNLRDAHMMETLDALMAWTTRRSEHVRAVVWAHNSHLGDARATQMGSWGELNLGQLAREPLEDWSREIPMCRKRIQRESEHAAGNAR